MLKENFHNNSELNQLNHPDLDKKANDTINSLRKRMMPVADELAKLKERINEAEKTQDIAALNTLKAESLPKMKRLIDLQTRVKRIRETGVVRPEVSGSVSVEDAMEIMGERDVLGPEAVEKVFGIKLKPDEIPAIPFSIAELERAEEFGQYLILRTDKDDLGQPLTMKNLMAMKYRQDYSESGSTTGGKKGKLTYSSSYEGEFFDQDPIACRWSLVDRGIIGSGESLATKAKGFKSVEKDYFQQTKLLKDYILALYPDQELPTKYQEAIAELESYTKANFNSLTDDEINEEMSNDCERYAKELSELKLNDLLRKTPAEELYDLVAYFDHNDQRLDQGLHNWTKRRNSDGALVRVGSFGVAGAHVSGRPPDDANDGLGFSSSRS
jgi:hypothetical protein